MVRYTKAWEPINRYLQNGCTDPKPIMNAIRRIESSVPKSDWAADDNKNTVSALNHFLQSAEQLPLDGITYIKGNNSAPELTIGEVRVSVRPEFVLRGTIRGKKRVGVLKLHYIKAKPMSPDSQAYISVMCHEWLNRYGPSVYEPHKNLCLSLDVYRHSLVKAPAAFTKRMREIEAACEEIARTWPTV